jgi:phenylpropionate dioxygenase-like ring-hydroxylating dioxygenase large terminal subunit
MVYKDFDELLEQWDPNRGIEDSATPPRSWYTDPDFYQQEISRIFERCWLPVGRLDQVEHPSQYFTGEIAGNPFVVVRAAEDGKLYAHHNVCRHKGAIVARQEEGVHVSCAFFQCPFHGWEYNHSGSLKKAPLLGPQHGFNKERSGLPSISVDIWGPLIFLDLDGPFGGLSNPRNLKEDVKELNDILEASNWTKLKYSKRVVCKSTQKGMQSISFRKGRYSSLLERAAYQFHVLHWYELRGLIK